MPDLTSALAAHRAAVGDLIAVAEKAAPNWNTPRAPGKWSPAQVVEHMAIALEENANVMAGRPSKIPTLPAFVRPLTRLVFNRIVRTGGFPKAKTNSAMTPARGPATAAEARARLESALAKFESESRFLESTRQPVASGAFGKVPLEDFVRFNELHARHHIKQIVVQT
jgi:hypothetical protein